MKVTLKCKKSAGNEDFNRSVKKIKEIIKNSSPRQFQDFAKWGVSGISTTRTIGKKKERCIQSEGR